MNDYLYLIINLASFSIPFIYSFERKMNFIRWWKPVFLSIALVGSIFIFWDILFTNDGVWGFNSNYHLDINVLGIPFEEAPPPSGSGVLSGLQAHCFKTA